MTVKYISNCGMLYLNVLMMEHFNELASIWCFIEMASDSIITAGFAMLSLCVCVFYLFLCFDFILLNAWCFSFRFLFTFCQPWCAFRYFLGNATQYMSHSHFIWLAVNYICTKRLISNDMYWLAFKRKSIILTFRHIKHKNKIWKRMKKEKPIRRIISLKCNPYGIRA